MDPHTLIFVLFCYTIIAICVGIEKFIYKDKYGYIVLKISSNKYKKGTKGKKEYEMNVAPFKENNKIYVPIKYIAKAVGIKKIGQDKENRMILSYLGKKIKVDNENILTVSSDNTSYRITENIKLKNEEPMITIGAAKDIFGLTVEADSKTGDIVFR